MANVYELWGCGICGESYDDEFDAEECCAEELEKLEAGYEPVRCPACTRDYKSYEYPEFGYDLNVAAIKVAGHCQTCNPHYSYDQQQAIEKMAWEESGIPMRLNA